APRRLVSAGEEGRRVNRQIITVGTEMVVDDVEEETETARVTGLDKALQIVGRAVTRIRSIEQNAVIAPVPRAGKIGDRQQFQRGDPEGGEMIEMTLDAGEVAGFAESPDMKLVDDDLLPRAPAPGHLGPVIGAGIDHHARPVHVVRLTAGGRV